jgi:hypothetical protein
MTTENTQVQTAEQTAASVPALVTLDPKSYVAQVYAPFEERLSTAIEAANGVTYEIVTTAGLEAAKRLRASFRDIRTQGENERKARKAPIIEIGKLLDAKYEELKEKVSPFELKYDADVKAEEQRREDEKAEKLRVEEERKAELDKKLRLITDAPLQAISMSADNIQAMIDALREIKPTVEEYQERYVEAETALAATIPALETLHQGKVAIEQQAAAEAERERQAKEQQQEQARIDGIQQQIAAIKNYVLDAADCEKSAQMEVLIAKAQAIVIDDSYAEFKDQAASAKESTINVLTRQLKFIKSEEAEAAEVLAAVVPPVASAEPAPAEVQAVDPAIVVSAPSLSTTPDTTSSPTISVTASQYFYSATPSALDLVHAIATVFKVNDMRALDWLQQADFNAVQLEQAA